MQSYANTIHINTAIFFMIGFNIFIPASQARTHPGCLYFCRDLARRDQTNRKPATENWVNSCCKQLWTHWITRNEYYCTWSFQTLCRRWQGSASCQPCCWSQSARWRQSHHTTCTKCYSLRRATFRQVAVPHFIFYISIVFIYLQQCFLAYSFQFPSSCWRI
jgi:hypothetical protein